MPAWSKSTHYAQSVWELASWHITPDKVSSQMSEKIKIIKNQTEIKPNQKEKKRVFVDKATSQTEYVSACGSKKWWCIESGCVLGTILANAGVPMIPHCCYGKVPSASLHLWRTAAVYPVYSPLLCPLLFLDNLPFLLQILNLCCQTVLSLKAMYSLLPGSPLYECLLSLVVISFSPCFSHFV